MSNAVWLAPEMALEQFAGALLFSQFDFSITDSPALVLMELFAEEWTTSSASRANHNQDSIAIAVSQE